MKTIQEAEEVIARIMGKESPHRAIKLEKEDFKITPNKTWIELMEKGLSIRKHPEYGVWEILEGSYEGKQYFDLNAAIYFTGLARKAIPTTGQWEIMMKSINPNINLLEKTEDVSIRKTLKLDLLGAYDLNENGNSFSQQGTRGYYWTRSYGLFDGDMISIDKENVCPARYANLPYAFTVRCLERNKGSLIDWI